MPISVIVPLAKEEPQWYVLQQQLLLLPEKSEVIIVAIKGENIARQINREAFAHRKIECKLLFSRAGRGIQLNCGAQQASCANLWFLHADSQIKQDNIDALFCSLAKHANSLCYFDLCFHDKYSRLLTLNEFAAKWRSDILGLPFGDQGFFLSKKTFLRLGGYAENTRYGEDHLLVWQAKLQGVKLCRCPSQLATSARKYQQYGWLKLTLKYQALWLKQALPQCLKWLTMKYLNR